MKELGAAESDPIKIREKCDATARHFVDVQSEQFQRLGVFGDWANPYLTLDPKYEAETLRVFATLVGKNLVYQGLRPVLWSTGCQTALAEAEIEYKEKVDPAIYVKFPIDGRMAAQKIAILADASLLIWTTTPWTLPANLAVAVAPNLDYALYVIAGQRLLLATALVDKLPLSIVRHPEPVEGSVRTLTVSAVDRLNSEENEAAIRSNFEKYELEPTNPVHARKIAELYVKLDDYSTAILWYKHAFDMGGQIDCSLETIIAELKQIDATPQRLAGPWKGSDLIGLTYTHPFLNDGRIRQIFSADFVTADAGTGLVHIAPGHGHDDYILGQQHSLPVLAPVDDRGCLTAEFLPANADEDVKALVGQYVFKANPLVIQILKDRSLLFAEEEYRHDYPHCWRSKTPIVFRAVKQWFIKVDAFRDDALKAIDGVKWIPENGRNRIRGAVESRPDWCISRQRTWGIPIPVFYGEGEQPLLSADVANAFATLVAKEGTGIWFAKSADELAVTLTTELEKSGSKTRVPLGLRKGKDTLDVWIDSGTSWAAVTAKRPEFNGQKIADLYLEGSDQHRGWFQSSLLTSVAAAGVAPYKAVLTNGFVVDIEGKKLSKSGEGYKKPVDLMTLVNEHGADVLRLWVASQDYQDDIPFSHDIFARVADTYRSIRNTLRILLGNLADFDPRKDLVPATEWTGLDQYIFMRFRQTANAAVESYAKYDFSQVYQSLNRFCAVELSSLYVDVLKDRLYCNATNDPQRRTAQSVIFSIYIELTKLLAPIVPYTAEEAWQMKGEGHKSVHLAPLPHHARRETDAALESRWTSLLELRSAVNEALETARRDKKIGKSLEAHVEITGRHPELAEGSVQPSDLEELFIVSKVVIKPTEGEETITVTRAEDHGMKKCIRCWKYWDHVGNHAEHPELCDRCTKVMADLKF